MYKRLTWIVCLAIISPTFSLPINFYTVEHHLLSTYLNILLSKTQLYLIFSLILFISSSKTLYSQFHFIGEFFAYFNISTSVACLVAPKSPVFDVTWFKICFPTTSIFLFQLLLSFCKLF